MTYDYLIVGSGFSGAVIAERVASQLNKKVLVIEKRSHIGGNAYDYYDDNGILIHKYGPHIFHTNSKKVWEYLSQFTQWQPYEHHVLGVIDGKKVPVPFNLNSLNLLFDHHEAKILESELIREFGNDAKLPILTLMKSSNQKLKGLADYIYKNIFYNYTLKQWELTPEQLLPSVTARVPVVISRDNRYFPDKYQAMPRDGYTKMFEKILNHKNIEISCNTDFHEINVANFKHIVFTGPIDEYFDFIHGELPYRSLIFETCYYEQDLFQEVGTINYPNDFLYTRITEFKHLTGQKIHGTITSTEYPTPYKRGHNIPYYPIPKEENAALHKKYKNEIMRLNRSVIFTGRLADYMYYNMDQAVARSLSVFEKEILDK